MKKVIVSALCAMTLVIAGCGSGPSPKEVSQNFIKDLQKGDMNDAKTLTISQFQNKFDLKDEKIAESVYSRMSADFGDETINGDHATVDAKVTSLDVGKIMASTMQSLIGNAFMNGLSGSSSSSDAQNMAEQALEKAITDPNAPKTTTDTQINLVQDKSGQWKIDSNNDSFISALTGNVSQMFNNSGQ